MEQAAVYIGFFCIIVIFGQVFNKWVVPLALILTIAGMLFSFIPFFPRVTLNPSLVLNIFLPILLYQISAFSSWQEFKKNIRPIGLLSIGHVLFITIIIAIAIKQLIPEIDWALAFVIGAVVAPPDDVAIVAIAEKISMPARVISILEGESMLNDAAALTLFRFALAAEITHQFMLIHALITFFAIIIGETIFGLLMGFILGELRKRITNPSLHVLASLLTPFLVYYPVNMLGGSGIIAVVATGFVIGHYYSTQFTPQFRLISRAMWPAFSFAIQSLLFLLVGLDLSSILKGIAVMPLKPLIIDVITLVALAIVGRFVWVYVSWPLFRNRNQKMNWPALFLISWSGMRGGISLAAALAVPFLPKVINGVNARDLIVFLVFTVIIATLVLQGLALPWIVKLMGIEKVSQKERYSDHLAELTARKSMISAVLRWLKNYKKQIASDQKLFNEAKLYIELYRMEKLKLIARLDDHTDPLLHDEDTEIAEDTSLQLQIIEIERTTLLDLWKKEKINYSVREKLLDHLDHRAKNLK
ncbi:MAG: sodium:proton antiporter [Proteobacteria bacterium]|nr:sodium:proton antiporter [Pseudomonadota bacterium]